ncbi:hypothetical protein VTO73DRAFT_6395 [Trametes versicolor]
MLLYIVLLCTAWLTWKLVRHASAPKSQINNLPGPASPSWATGHLLQLYDRQGWDFHRELLNYGPVFKLQGIFGRPILCVYDSVVMHHIAVKNQHIFEEIRWLTAMSTDIFGHGIVASVGEEHRKQKRLMNHIFSVNNLQQVTPVLHEVAQRLTHGIHALVKDGTTEVDVGRYMGRVALELIGQAVIGHSFDPLTESHSHPYTEALKDLVPALQALRSYYQAYLPLRSFIPPLLRRPLMNVLPSRRVRNLLRTVDALQANAVKIYTEKKGNTELADQLGEGEVTPGRAKDLVSVLLRANARASDGNMLSEEEMIAQLSTLVFAATDTTSNALARVIDCIVQRPDVQIKLREEITAAKRVHSGGDLSYEELLALPYLDAVYRETLRVHPPVPLIFREARADSTLPLSKPVRGADGTLMHSIFVPEGTLVFFPIHAANTNPALWGPDGGEWRPERWLAPLPDTLTEAKMPGAYSHIMTFWDGGRACMGFKFAELEMKMVLAELLSAFRFEDTGKPVVWNVGEVVYPTVGQESTVPAFPMKVTAL